MSPAKSATPLAEMPSRPLLPVPAGLALFSQAALVVGGLLWEPHLEGRNTHATTLEIYFKDPFLAYVYLGSVPFFVAVYRAFRMFGQARQHGGFSLGTVAALLTIKRCALGVIGFAAGAMVLIILFGDGEDRPAGLFMCLLVVLASGVMAISAVRCARYLQRALKLPEGVWDGV